MNKNVIIRAFSAAVGVGILGLIVGYLIYGKIGGEYISLGTLFSSSDNILDSAVRSVSGIDAVRSKIFNCGWVGAVIGLVVGILPSLKK